MSKSPQSIISSFKINTFGFNHTPSIIYMVSKLRITIDYSNTNYYF